MEDVIYQCNELPSFSCDTSKLLVDDLNMFVDIMEEMCADATAPPKRSNLRRNSKVFTRHNNRPPKIYRSNTNSSCDSDDDDDNNDLFTANNNNNQKDKSAMTKQCISNSYSEIFSYFDEEVSLPNVESMADLLLETPPPTPPRSTSLSASPSTRSPSTSPPNSLRSSPVPTPPPPPNDKVFRCQIKDMIYKSRRELNAVRPGNRCGRLRHLVNLFENCNIDGSPIIPSIKDTNNRCPIVDHRKSSGNGLVDDRSCGSVHEIIQKYNQQLAKDDAAERKRFFREQPSSPPLGKFKAVRSGLENFFLHKFGMIPKAAAAAAAKHEEALEKRSAKEISSLLDNGMDNMLIKYNKLKTIKTFYQTHHFMERCHDMCADISDRLFDGIEKSIIQHEGEMYKYFESLTVIIIIATI